MLADYAEIGCRSNFTPLDGASHPQEPVAAAAALDHAGVGICDTNSLAGAVRGHFAAEQVGIPFAVGCRPPLEEGAEYLVWATDRASYGRLAHLLSLGPMRSPKGQCPFTREKMIGHAGGCCMVVAPHRRPSLAFGDRLLADSRGLGGRLAVPLLCAATVRFDDNDEERLDALAGMAAAAGAGPLATSPHGPASATCSPPSALA